MLALKHICKAFSGKTVADNISLSVADGKLLAVLGPSGCGFRRLSTLRRYRRPRARRRC